MSTFVILVIICVVVFIYVTVKGKQEHKELMDAEQTTNEYLEYDAKTRTIKLYKRHPSLAKRFSFEDVYDTYTTHHKEKQVFTGVSVGPVVRGSVKTVGGNKSHFRKTGTYFFKYNQSAALSTIEKSNVDKIKLTDELCNEAYSDTSIMPYIKYGVIEVVSNGEHPDMKKCIAIRNWICGEKSDNTEPDNIMELSDNKKLEYYKKLYDEGKITKEEYVNMRKTINGQ